MKKITCLFACLALFGCQSNSSPSAETDTAAAENQDTLDLGMHPDWTLQSSIYEVNVRQHTPEGTFNALRRKLPELKDLGVEILWIMPIQPIGVKNRKGGLGSYYSIHDYTAVNPEFGTMDDFKAFVTAAHDLGLKVILDWVANHTAWDHVWMEQHPDWYTRENGKVIPPVADWSDVADLNYDSPALRKAMLEAMKFWVREAGIDGYRCDVAMMVPMEFWNRSRTALDSIKPVFMLAEAEGAEFHEQAFDMTYGWEMHHIMNQVAKGEMDVSDISSYLEKMDSTYPEGAYRMYFTTNHDENSWNGTVFERMPDDYRGMFVMAATLPNAVPLLYSGQEYGLNKRLAFFEKDSLTASDSSLFGFYQEVVELKMTHPALRNGKYQGDFQPLKGQPAERVFGYTREINGEAIMVLLNFSDKNAGFALPEGTTQIKWTDVITGIAVETPPGKNIALPPHTFLLLKSIE